MNNDCPKPILICDTQPVAVEGLRWLLDNTCDLCFAGAVCSLDAAFELARTLDPAAILLDKGFGVRPVMDWLRHCWAEGASSAAVIFGSGIAEAEALRLFQAGAKGVLPRTAEPETILACLRAVVAGTTWMQDGVFSNGKLVRPRRSALTARELQITELVEHGMKNREIARTLGIRTGTVKIHLKHIFAKRGVCGRYGLALTSLRGKNPLPDLAPSGPVLSGPDGTARSAL